MMRKIGVNILLAFLLLPILSACWNQKELTDLAFVTALGVDKGKNKMYDVSFQIVIPANVSQGQTGGGQGLPIAVYKSTGNTLTEAARSATKAVSRRLYYAHTNLVVISEEIAKDGLLDLLDALDRDPEFRTTTEIVVARDTTAALVVSGLSNLDKLPVNKITKQIKASEAVLGENTTINIDDFIMGLVSSGREPIMNGYKVTGKQEDVKNADNLQTTIAHAFLVADGMAVFKNGKLTGWIDRKKARGALWILKKVKSTDIIIDWNGKKDALTFAPIRSKTKVSVKFKKGEPVISIYIKDEGWISEANTAIDLTNAKEIEKIDIGVEEEIKKQITASIKEAQKLQSDIFGFGERVHSANPKLWKEMKGNWNERFTDLEVNVKVDSYTRREGIRTKPFWSDFKK